MVEDEPENWMVLERLLRDAGFQVRVAENGEQGVEIFREWRPQFIWMDLRMPVMDGIEATRRIRELEGGRDVKIAAVTASGFVGQRSEVLAAGLDDYVAKPYRPDEIFECMERHLGVRYRRAEAAPPEVDAALPLGAERMARPLPPDLRDGLESALVSLDSDRIVAVIEDIAALDAPLAARLADLANRYSYSAILRAITTTRAN